MENNPQALVNPEALDRLRAGFRTPGRTGARRSWRKLLAAQRETLASAIGEVFVFAAGALAVAFVVTIFLPEIPLRGRGAGPGRLET